MLFVVLFPVAV